MTKVINSNGDQTQNSKGNNVLLDSKAQRSSEQTASFPEATVLI